MKRFTLLAFAFIGLAACDAPPTPTEPALKTAPTGAPSFAKLFNDKIDVSGTFFNPCPPEEPVAFVGSIHVLATGEQTPTSSDVKFHLNTQGVAGVGVISGDRYSIIENFKEHFVFSPSGFVDEFDDRFRMIRQGSDDNFWFRLTARVTFPPFEFEIIREEIECRG